MRQVTVNTTAQTQSNFAANGKHLEEVDLTFQLEGYFYVGQTIEGLDAYQYNDCNDFMYIDTKRCLLFNTNKNIVGYYVRQ